MSAVSGTRRAIKELVDGTIRVQVDIDPRFRKAFFDLFPDIDMPVALAPLVEVFEKREPEPQKDEKPRGGPLAKLAGMLSLDPKFQEWLFISYPEQAAGALPNALPEDRAASTIRCICSVRSRAELDHVASAAETFHAAIRKPWAEFNGAKP